MLPKFTQNEYWLVLHNSLNVCLCNGILLFQIGTNGYFSFSEPFYSASPQTFPGVSTDVSSFYLVAPFWDDVDLRRRGNIFYEVHTTETSQSLLSQVSNFVSNGSFSGTWMLVARWDEVHSWPDGESDGFREFIASFFGINSTFVS